MSSAALHGTAPPAALPDPPRAVRCHWCPHTLPAGCRGTGVITRPSNAGVVTGAPIVQQLRRRCSQAQRLIEFTAGQQAGFRGDLGTMKLQLQAPVKSHPEARFFGCTHQMFRFAWIGNEDKSLFMRLQCISPASTCEVIWEIRGKNGTRLAS
jgi:hypothetical protein